MGTQRAPSGPRRFLSLRWQALIAISLVLMVVNGTLALMADRYSRAQFELQQSSVRGNQVRQLRGLLARNFEEMARLVRVMPLLGSDDDAGHEPNSGESLASKLESEVTLLNQEWNLQSIFWVSPDGQPVLIWPEDALAPGRDLVDELIRKNDGATQLLICQSACLQFLAAPILWGGALRRDPGTGALPGGYLARLQPPHQGRGGGILRDRDYRRWGGTSALPGDDPSKPDRAHHSHPCP